MYRKKSERKCASRLPTFMDRFTCPYCFKNVQTRNEIAKINEIGAGTVSNIQVMSLVFGASKAIHSKE
jgi:transcription elongation factor Elf1